MFGELGIDAARHRGRADDVSPRIAAGRHHIAGAKPAVPAVETKDDEPAAAETKDATETLTLEQIQADLAALEL